MNLGNEMIHYEDADWKIARTPPWENFEIKLSKEIPTNSDVVWRFIQEDLN